MLAQARLLAPTVGTMSTTRREARVIGGLRRTIVIASTASTPGCRADPDERPVAVASGRVVGASGDSEDESRPADDS